MFFSMTVVSTATSSRLASSTAPDLRPASMVGVEQPFDALFADPLAPSNERGRVDRRVVLKERLAGEVLVIRVLDPTRDHRLVREPERVLEIEQPRHQPWRGRRPAGGGGEKPGPLVLEELPVDQRRQRHEFMAHVDQVDEPGPEEVVLLGRAWAVLHQGAENCRVLAEIL
jgi:hypothetical protein